MSGPNVKKWRQNVQMNQHNLLAAYKAGVKLGFGADSGANPLRVPGFAEHRELQLMCDAGLPPLAAISAATQGSAEILGLADRGVVAPGKLADLVVLDADPSKDVANTQRIHAVWHRGKKTAGPIENFMP